MTANQDYRIFTMVVLMKEISLDSQAEHVVALLNALGNPARYRIMEILAESPSSIVADIVDRLPIAQATVSQHLAVLKEVGAIHGERSGTGRCCRIDIDAMAAFAESLVGWTIRLISRATSAEVEQGGQSCTR